MKTRIIVGVLWIVILLGLLFYPMNASPIYSWGGFPHWDKVAHFGLFGVTGIVGVFVTGFLNRLKDRVLFSLLLGFALAAGTEVGQSLIPHRDMSIYDFAADMAGLIAGLLFYALLYRNRSLRSLLRL